MITETIIKDLYIKYGIDSTGGGRDSWDVAADIINKLLPRSEYPTDAEFYFHVKVVWEMIQEYIDSTYMVTAGELVE